MVGFLSILFSYEVFNILRSIILPIDSSCKMSANQAYLNSGSPNNIWTEINYSEIH